MKYKMDLWKLKSLDLAVYPLRPMRKLSLRAAPESLQVHTSDLFGRRKGVNGNTHSIGFKEQPENDLGWYFPPSFKINYVTFKSYKSLSLPSAQHVYLERERGREGLLKNCLKSQSLRKFITGSGALQYNLVQGLFL